MKKKVIIALGVLMVCMSSCVYSLFPIYTDETIVYLPELNGKWMASGGEDEYITFQSGTAIDASITVDPDANQEDEPRVTKKMSVTFNHDEYIIVNGDTVKDPKVIRAYWESELETLGEEMAAGVQKIAEGFANAVKGSGQRKASYSRKGKNYHMTVHEDGEITGSFLAHVVDIDGDLFLDLYPNEDMFDMGLAMNMFPVHTFMKIKLDQDQMSLVHFDLDKLKKLFESNLIRMRHENVDGTILMTAQPKEIQKFLSKYSDDESVYDGTETYTRSTK